MLTLLSIVQAFAVELMWAHLSEQAYLYDLSFMAILSWLQIVATLLGILLIWLIYSDLVLRLSWVPTTTDAIFPFLVGILEFAQIGALGPTTIGLWFAILSVLFAAMAWISQATMKRARLDRDNDDFFENIDPASWRDHFVTVIPAVTLLIIGVYIWLMSNQGWFALMALIFAIMLLTYQIRMNHVFTQRSYQRE
jgi:hypothetical protein